MRISDWSSDVCSSDLFPEIGREFGVFAQIIDDLADRPMLGHGDQLALHQSPGGFLRIGERCFDGRAIVGGHGAQHCALLFGLQIRSEEHTSELQSLMRISYAVFCLKKKKTQNTRTIRYDNMTQKPQHKQPVDS